MTNSNFKRILVFGLLFCLLANIAIVYAGIIPSNPTSITYKKNYTDTDVGPRNRTDPRAAIHVILINETQQTQNWKAYVGNVTGVFGLQDGNHKSMYEWTITNLTGELYAVPDTNAAGLVRWQNTACLNRTDLDYHTKNFNHSLGQPDILNKTFTNAGLFNMTSFYAGAKLVTDPAGTTCYGLYLNKNGNRQYVDWQEMALTDLQTNGAGNKNIIFATILENDANGFNNQPYDFQILLPDRGNVGAPASIRYSFYIELT